MEAKAFPPWCDDRDLQILTPQLMPGHFRQHWQLLIRSPRMALTGLGRADDAFQKRKGGSFSPSAGTWQECLQSQHTVAPRSSPMRQMTDCVCSAGARLSILILLGGAVDGLEVKLERLQGHRPETKASCQW